MWIFIRICILQAETNSSMENAFNIASLLYYHLYLVKVHFELKEHYPTHNTNSELYFAQYRAYDPETGMWLSRDPLVDSELIEGLNMYAYVSNDPIHYVDLNGLQRSVTEKTKEYIDDIKKLFDKGKEGKDKLENLINEDIEDPLTKRLRRDAVNDICGGTGDFDDCNTLCLPFEEVSHVHYLICMNRCEEMRKEAIKNRRNRKK